MTAGDDEDEMFDEGEEPNIMLEEERIQQCSGKITCTLRKGWCTETFRDDVPADCLEKFDEQCCGTVIPDKIQECKAEVVSKAQPEETEPEVTVECFAQDFVNGDKNKYDSCTACCGNKVNDC